MDRHYNCSGHADSAREKFVEITELGSFSVEAMEGGLNRLTNVGAVVLGLTFGAGMVAFPQVCAAQDTQADSSVEKLYQEAKAAQQRGLPDEAIAKYQQILKLDPGLAAAYNNLGMLYFQQEDFPDAARALEEGLRRDPSMTPSVALLGLSYYRMGEFKKARPRLEEAVRRNPSDQEAQLYLGRCLFSLGEREKGVAVLQKLVERAPSNQSALYSLGRMYVALARDTLTQLKKLGPDSYLANLLDGETMEGLHNYEGALASYRRAATLDPRQRDIHYRIAGVYYLMGNFPQAISELKEEITGHPRNCMALWKLGHIFLDTNGDPQGATPYLDKALLVCPDLPDALLDDGQVLIHEEKYSKAVERLRRGIDLDDTQPRAHFLLGQAYQKLGRTEDANREYGIFRRMEAAQKKSRFSPDVNKGGKDSEN